MKETYERWKKKRYDEHWRHVCAPKSNSNSDWASRRMH